MVLIFFFIYIYLRVLKVELDTYKIRVKSLEEENRSLRQASVSIVSGFVTIILMFFVCYLIK